MQQLTRNMDLSCSFYYLFFSFVLLELNPLIWRGKSWGRNSEMWKIVKNSKTILPFSCCPLIVLWILGGSQRGGFQTAFGCGIFAYSSKLPAYSGAFLLIIDIFSFFTYSWSFFTYFFSFSYLPLELFLLTVGKVCLTSALRDCKQRSWTVSKKAPTVSKKASPGFGRCSPLPKFPQKSLSLQCYPGRRHWHREKQFAHQYQVPRKICMGASISRKIILTRGGENRDNALQPVQIRRLNFPVIFLHPKTVTRAYSPKPP